MADPLDNNLFMICKSLDRSALTEMPTGYHVRPCRRDELDLWKRMHNDDPAPAKEYLDYMDAFFQRTYSRDEALFFATTLLVCTSEDQPIAACGLWKAYDAFNSIHWFKVRKEFEGQGIGRALLSLVMKDLQPEDYPVYLHTQPGSNRALKLYTDFGFDLIEGELPGIRPNQLVESLPLLKELMPEKAFQQLRFSQAPPAFLKVLEQAKTVEF